MPEVEPGTVKAYDPFRWLRWGGLILLVITVISTAVYYALGLYYERADWTVQNCLFMVVITLTTIGYGDWLQIKTAPLAQYYTMLLAVIGMGVPAFVITNAIGLIVEGLFSDVFRRRRMHKQIEHMEGHIILCGVGTTGYHCAAELIKTERPFVAIDRSQQHLEMAIEDLGEFPFLVGGAEDDDLLIEAGVKRAAGLITCLSDDKNNLFVTLSARALNPDLRVVSKVVDEVARPKLGAAGATKVVNTTAIGGMRMVSELVRPSVVTFLDAMIRSPKESFRFEELTVEKGCEVEGCTLASAELRKGRQALVVAVRAPGDDHFSYNPSADFQLDVGCTIVLLGQIEDLERLRPRFKAV